MKEISIFFQAIEGRRNKERMSRKVFGIIKTLIETRSHRIGGRLKAMSAFEFEIEGRLHDWPIDWEIGQSITFDKCTFTRLASLSPGSFNQDDLSVKTKIEANDAESARKLGFETSIMECEAFAFCIGNKINIHNKSISIGNIMEIKSLESNEVLKVIEGISPIFIADENLRINDIEVVISDFKHALTGKSPRRIESVMRAIHWLARASDELNKTDCFIDLWIALDALIDNEEGNKDQRIQRDLVDLYRKENAGRRCKVKKGYKIIDIYKMRKKIFHEGFELGREYKILDELKKILKDLLRSELGLRHLGFARNYIDFPKEGDKDASNSFEISLGTLF